MIEDLLRDLRINNATIDAETDLNRDRRIGFPLKTLATPIVDQRTAAVMMYRPGQTLPLTTGCAVDDD
jgi:hypothetical protein